MNQDVVDLILQDHRELERLFDQLLNAPERRASLTPVMTTLLTAHSRAEEAEVYPAARNTGAQDDVEHSQKEHLQADQLAKKVASIDPQDPSFAAALRELVDAVKHHVAEEEKTVLPGIRANIDDKRREQLGVAFLAARKQHLGAQPDDITKAELEQQAANAGVSGAASMTKHELADTLEEHAES